MSRGHPSATDWQKRIYLSGFAGQRQPLPIDLATLEDRARAILSSEAFAYIAGGAGREGSVKSNRSAFDSYQIVPRMLRDVSERDTAVHLFGRRIPSPLVLSPLGALELAHPASDMGVARASSELGIPFIFSNQASTPMEEVAGVMGLSPRWFQLYWSKSRDLIASFVSRAEKCGCSAVVVTLDTTLLGWRTRDLDLAYLPFLEGRGIAQYTSDPVFQKLMDGGEPEESKSLSIHSLHGLLKMTRAYPGSNFIAKLFSGRPLRAVRTFVNIYSNPAVTWADLRFLRELTSLPVLLKGILHPDDALRAADAGMNGVIVSNHGGRQVDGSIATLDALPGIVGAVGNKMPVLIDGGVRGGADMFKALALGATAVCIGRPYAYGLAVAGSSGVYQVMRNIMAEFELTMALAGCKGVREIGREALR